MSPTDLKTWLENEGLSKQALALAGFDGVSLMSATDEELSELDGLSGVVQAELGLKVLDFSIFLYTFIEPLGASHGELNQPSLLNLKCDEPLSTFAFNFNMRSYTWALHSFAARCSTACACTRSNRRAAAGELGRA